MSRGSVAGVLVAVSAQFSSLKSFLIFIVPLLSGPREPSSRSAIDDFK